MIDESLIKEARKVRKVSKNIYSLIIMITVENNGDTAFVSFGINTKSTASFINMSRIVHTAYYI